MLEDTDHPPPSTGLRERKKLDKSRRIKDAAKALFIEKGYENTTIREISKRAGVGTGTIFRYASNKRDLLFLIYNDLRETAPPVATDLIPDDRPLIEQLELFFRELIGFFADQSELARDILREAALYDSGLQMERYWRIRKSAEDELTGLLVRARDQGRIPADAEIDLLVTLLFDIYRSALRRWSMTDGRDADAGTAMVASLFRVALTGIGARDGEL